MVMEVSGLPTSLIMEELVNIPDVDIPDVDVPDADVDVPDVESVDVSTVVVGVETTVVVFMVIFG